MTKEEILRMAFQIMIEANKHTLKSIDELLKELKEAYEFLLEI